MENINILIAGVGGQGLVLATKIVSEVAAAEGYDVKTNDVIGLSQRGGKVWGSVRIGKTVHSPNISEGQADIIIGMEPVEGYRYSHLLKDNGLIIMNTYEVPSSTVQQEQEKYPHDFKDKLKEKFEVIEVDALKIGRELNNLKVTNTVLVAILAKKLDIKKETWLKVIKENVPPKYINENIEAFEIGYSM